MTQQALRPHFTRRLLKALSQGKAINLVGAPGQGRQRLLDDLRHSAKTDTVVLYADMQAHKAGFSGFLSTLGSQARAAGIDAAEPDDLAGLQRTLEDSGRPVWLLLHRYDALLDNPHIDPAFGPAFVNQLNSLRNLAQFSLLCVTARPHNSYVVFVGDKTYGNSWLELQTEQLPPLDQQAARAELKRRLPRDTPDEHLNLLAAATRHAYSWLEYAEARYANGEDAHLHLQERLRRWQRQFSRRQLRNAVGTGGVNRFLRGVKAWLILLSGYAGDFLQRVNLLGKLWRAVRKGKDRK